MEYSKDIIFNIKYNEKNNLLEQYKENENKRWTSKIKSKLNKLKDCKTITIITISCFLLMILDFSLIYNFISIIQNKMII